MPTNPHPAPEPSREAAIAADALVRRLLVAECNAYEVARALERFAADILRREAKRIGDSAGVNSLAYEEQLIAAAARLEGGET